MFIFSRNKYIHMIFIPIILTSLVGMINSSAPFIVLNTSNIIGVDIPFGISLVLLLPLLLLYIKIEQISGLCSTVVYSSAFLLIEYLRVLLEKDGISSLKVFEILHASAWIAQFIGHGIF